LFYPQQKYCFKTLLVKYIIILIGTFSEGKPKISGVSGKIYTFKYIFRLKWATDKAFNHISGVFPKKYFVKISSLHNNFKKLSLWPA